MSGNTLSAAGITVASAPHVAVATAELASLVEDELLVPDPLSPDVAKAFDKATSCGKKKPCKSAECSDHCKPGA